MNEFELKRIVEAVLFVSDKPMTVKEIWQKLFGPVVGNTDKKKANPGSNGDKPECEAATETGSKDGAVADQAPSDSSVGPDEANDNDVSVSQETSESVDEEELFIDYGVSKDDVYRAVCALQSDYMGRGCELREVASGYRFQVNEDLSIWLQRWKAEKPPRYSRAVLETLAIIAYKQPITRAEIEDIRGVAVSSHIVKGLLEREWVRIVGHKEVPGRPALFATTKAFLDYFNVSSLEELPTLAEIKELGVRQSDEGEGNAVEKTANDVAVIAPAQENGTEALALAEEPEPPIQTEPAVLADEQISESAQLPDESLSLAETTGADSVAEENVLTSVDDANVDAVDDTLATNSADNAIKNAVECEEADELLENEPVESVQPDVVTAVATDGILAQPVRSGSVFDALEMPDRPAKQEVGVSDELTATVDHLQAEDDKRASMDLPNATAVDATDVTDA